MSSTLANYCKGNHNSSRADRGQFGDLIEESSGRSGGQADQGNLAQSELHELSSPLFEQENA